jgi:hypothetical protein
MNVERYCERQRLESPGTRRSTAEFKMHQAGVCTAVAEVDVHMNVCNLRQLEHTVAD